MHRLATISLLLCAVSLVPPVQGQTLSGPEVLVAQPPPIPQGTSSQEDPRIALADSGQVFVAWERLENQPFSGSDRGIFARAFDAADSSPGELVVADGTLNETDPSLAGNSSGKVVVVYNVDDLSNIPACTSAPAGKVFHRVYLNGVSNSGDQVNANGGGGTKGVVGMSPAGTFAAAYEGNACPGLNIQKGIKVRRFDPSLATANLNGLVSQLPLSVDVDATGGMAVAIADGSSVAGPCDTADSCTLVVRRFAANGSALSSVTFAPYANTGVVTTFAPALAVRGDGGFVVVWVRLDFTTSQTLFVVGRRYDAAGQPVGAEFEISAGVVVPGSQGFSAPSIAMSQSGDFVVGFVIEDRAYVRSYSAAGQPAGPPVLITNQDVSGISVALADTGLGAVAYTTGFEGTVSYRRFSTNTTVTPCTPAATRLCLNGGRYAVTSTWRTANGATGSGQAFSLTGDTGYFWFFNSANVEMIVKVLNGCGVNSRYWVFAGGLTDVEVELRVQDTKTGIVRTYRNPQGTPFQPIQDTGAFATCP
jgi:hypothetical protein